MKTTMKTAPVETAPVFGVGSQASIEGENVVVIAYTKGWYKVQYADGTEMSYRAKDLEPAIESMEPEEVEDSRVSGAGMKEALAAARAHYEKVKRPTGKESMNNGDLIAAALLICEPIEVCQLAEMVCGLPKGSLFGRYAWLNPGQIRMNSGNRIRGLLRRLNAEKAETESQDELDAVLAKVEKIEHMLEDPRAVLEYWELAEHGSTGYGPMKVE